MQKDDERDERLAMAQMELERVTPEAAPNGRSGLFFDLEMDQEPGFPRLIRNRRQKVDLAALAFRNERQLLFEELDALSGEACRQLAVSQSEEIQKEGAEQILEQPVVAGHGGESLHPVIDGKHPPRSQHFGAFSPEIEPRLQSG